MHRVRFGYAHVANNRYEEWKMYAVGGSANPTIFSEGNYFIAPNNPDSKEVSNLIIIIIIIISTFFGDKNIKALQSIFEGILF